MDTWRGLRLTLTAGHERRVASVAGEVDVATVGALHVFLAHCIYGAAGPGELVVDLSAVTFMGASGLTALVRADNLAREVGVRLRLGAVSECVSRILKVTGLGPRFMPSSVGPVSMIGPGRSWSLPARVNSE